MSAVDHEAAVAKLLADLGDTPDAVADRLRALGIKGKKGEPCDCPVAKLLRGNGYADVEVTSYGVWPRGSDVEDEVPPPVAVSAFIRRFDSGVYLDLVEVP